MTQEGETLECEYLISDYGQGLALLKIKSATDLGRWPERSALGGAQAKAGDAVAMLGYPAMSDTLLRDTRGKVSHSSLSSDVLIETTSVIEIIGGHAEFGMSGGVVSNRGGGFLGLLAFQIFKAGEGQAENTILAIPAVQVLSWLDNYFATPNQNAVDLVQSSVQLMDHSELTFASGSLSFIYLDPYASGTKMVIITPLRASVSRLYGKTNGDLVRYQNFLLDHSDCEGQVFGFRKRGLIGTYGGGGMSMVGTMRALENPNLEPLIRLWCNGSEEAIASLARIFHQTCVI